LKRVLFVSKLSVFKKRKIYFAFKKQPNLT
jgi:hypothetical protein